MGNQEISEILQYVKSKQGLSPEQIQSLLQEVPDEVMFTEAMAASTEQLKEMYIDAIWTYHEKGKMVLSNAQFDKLKNELNRRGSGFTSLRRDDVKFVEAYLAYARGEPILSDKDYEQLKSKVFSKGKIEEMAEFLGHVKSKDRFTNAMEGSLEQMKEMYVDAIWSYHETGKMTLSNEQFDALKQELNKRGSGFTS